MNIKIRLLNTVADIRFWILVFFMIRMLGITNPPLETGHSWRQCFTNMVARNFLETDACILYPRTDMTGVGDGIIGSEFPVYNYLIFLVSKVFGFRDWYGRIINLIVSSIGIWYFYRLNRRLFGNTVAFNATIVLLASIWFAFSRKVMPDTFSVSLMMTGLFYGYLFFTSGRSTYLVAYIILSATGALSKLPSVLYLGFLIIPLVSVRSTQQSKTWLMGAGAIVLSVTCLWYFIWVPHLVNEYGNRLYYPRGFIQGFTELAGNGTETLERFYFTSFYSFIALAAFLGGAFYMFRNRMKLLLSVAGIGLLLFLGFMGLAGRYFSEHNYYIIPFTPVMALVAGYGIARFRKSWQIVLLVLIAFEGIANQWQDFFIKDSELYHLDLETIADQVSNQDDLIIINGGGNPRDLFYTHRKGWSTSNAVLADTVRIRHMVGHGANFLFVDKSEYSGRLNYALVFSDDHFDVYRLTE